MNEEIENGQEGQDDGVVRSIDYYDGVVGKGVPVGGYNSNNKKMVDDRKKEERRVEDGKEDWKIYKIH
eukprot:scaffold25432_cov130-Amphora_coffeaeformis.AAC.1